jgi:hypothetical protein
MTLEKKPSEAGHRIAAQDQSSKPSSEDGAKEKVIEEIVRDADLKKFDPELEEVIHPPKPAEDE